MGHAWAHINQLPITLFRFFTVYGPWGRPDMAPFKFTRGILEGRPIDVYNHGKMWRDFTYVGDLVRGIRLLIDAVPGGPETASRRPLPTTEDPLPPCGAHSRNTTQMPTRWPLKNLPRKRSSSSPALSSPLFFIGSTAWGVGILKWFWSLTLLLKAPLYT